MTYDQSVSKRLSARLQVAIADALAHTVRPAVAADQVAATTVDMALQLLQETQKLIAASSADRKAAAPIASLAALSQALDGADGAVASTGIAYARGRIDSTDEPPVEPNASMTSAVFQDYLVANIAGCAELIVDGVRALPGGFSKQTLLLDVVNAPWGDDACVIRMDSPTDPLGRSVIEEEPVIRAAFAAGVRVAEPLWLNTVAEPYGECFLVSRRASGSNDTSAWEDDPAATRRFASDLGLSLAILHQPSVLVAAGGLPTESAGDALGREIGRWRSKRDESDLGPDPILTFAFDWLVNHRPKAPGPAVIVHGDLGFHNMLLTDGALCAILDWEFTHPGSAQEDLTYVRPFVEKMGVWPEFLASYVAAGGEPYDEEQAHYYAVWQNVRNAAACACALRKFVDSPSGDVRVALAGLGFGPQFTRKAGELIVAAG